VEGSHTVPYGTAVPARAPNPPCMILGGLMKTFDGPIATSKEVRVSGTDALGKPGLTRFERKITGLIRIDPRALIACALTGGDASAIP